MNRKINFIYKKYIDVTYGEFLNSQTIEKLSLLKINKLFLKEDKDLREIILHNVIDQWISNNYEETITFFNKLKRIINRTKIKLNIIEQQSIQILEERIFSKGRHIKVLLIESKLAKNEHAGVKFTNADLFIKSKLLRTIMTGEFILTNYKIIFSNSEDTKEFKWKDISMISFENYGFLFKYEKQKYVIRIHDQRSLSNTIKNFLSKKVKIKGWKDK